MHGMKFQNVTGGKFFEAKFECFFHAGRGVVRNTGFCGQNAAAGCIWNFKIMYFLKNLSQIQSRDCLLLRIHTHLV